MSEVKLNDLLSMSVEHASFLLLAGSSRPECQLRSAVGGTGWTCPMRQHASSAIQPLVARKESIIYQRGKDDQHLPILHTVLTGVTS
jgi:hypothetical protein